jgi:transposase-like protein
MKTPKNRYAKSSKLSERRFRALVRLVAADLTASQIAQVTGLNRNTVNRYLAAIRLRMAEWCAAQAPLFGVVEADESYFGPRRVKGVGGRGAGRKTIVFGIFERGGQVWCEIVPDVTRPTLQGLIRGKVALESVVNTDGWRSYNGLVELGYGHKRVDHGRDEFARGDTHINGIESFWAYAKTRLTRFRGLPRATFHLHLKECEFRFNNRHVDIGRMILKICREKTLF